jgi:hypothetical protein
MMAITLLCCCISKILAKCKSLKAATLDDVANTPWVNLQFDFHKDQSS